MADHTRTDGDDAPGPDPDEAHPADLGQQIDELRAEGRLILALAVPWSESVRSLLDHYEQSIAPLHLDDDVHRQLSRDVGVDQLYEILDRLSLAASAVS